MREQLNVFQAISLNSARFGMFASDLADLLSPPAPPSPPFALFLLSLPLKREKEVTFTKKKTRISRQDACADNIDPWLPLKNLLCLTDFSSFGLHKQQNESQVPVKMSSWAGSLPVQNGPWLSKNWRLFQTLSFYDTFNVQCILLMKHY